MTRLARRSRGASKPLERAVAIGAAPVPAKFVQAALRSIESKDSTLALGIDGGARLLKKHPDFERQLWVGDWDSLGSAPRGHATDLLHLPSEKDRSDLAYALAVLHALQSRGDARLREVLLLGVTGGRPDHHLAGLMEIVDASAEFASPVLFRMLEPGCEWFAVHARRPVSLTWTSTPGEPVSLFSFDGRASIRSLKGLKYGGPRGQGFQLGAGSHGLSNEATGRRVEVRLESGTLLGVLPGGSGYSEPKARNWIVKTGRAK
jgi:thiamine pyrophosphokinase